MQLSHRIRTKHLNNGNGWRNHTNNEHLRLIFFYDHGFDSGGRPLVNCLYIEQHYDHLSHTFAAYIDGDGVAVAVALAVAFVIVVVVCNCYCFRMVEFSLKSILSSKSVVLLLPLPSKLIFGGPKTTLFVWLTRFRLFNIKQLSG